MSSKHGRRLTAQGVDLIDLVIERVRENPRCIAGFCGDHPLSQPRLLAPDFDTYEDLHDDPR